MQEMLIGEIYQDLGIITANDSISANRPSNDTSAEHLPLQVIKLFYKCPASCCCLTKLYKPLDIVISELPAYHMLIFSNNI